MSTTLIHPWAVLYISTSNHLATRVIWDKSPELVFQYIEIIPNAVRVISVLKTNEGDLSQIIPEYVQVITG